MPDNPDKYVIVQHSGYGYKGDPQFRKGLEYRTVSNKAFINRITKAGGLVFDTHKEATDFESSAPYPKGYDGLIPIAQGTFHPTIQVDGLAIYLPVVKVVG